jgi:hypothetical protein
MEYKRNLRDRAGNILGTGVKYIIGGCILFSLASHNGLLDSNRTKQTEQLYDKNNPTKVVSGVEEEWRDNSPFSLASSIAGGAGYNPRVIRKVTFEDSSQTTLDYRVLAHQPFRRWIRGDEFNPQVGEMYEVTKHNQFVRKVE